MIFGWAFLLEKNTMSSKIYFRDILALLVLGGGFYLISQGIDSMVGYIMALTTGFYFSGRIEGGK